MNRDRYYRYLFVYRQAKAAVFEANHVGWGLGVNATFGEKGHTESTLKLFPGPLKTGIAVLEIGAVYQHMQLAVHIAKYGNGTQRVLAYKLVVMPDQPHGGDVQIREMIGPKDIALLAVKWLFIFNVTSVEEQEEKEPTSPKPVECAYPVFTAGYENGNQEKGQEQCEDEAKNKQAISGVNKGKRAHA